MQTEAAAGRIRSLIEGQQGVEGVRVGIKSRGCNGMSYTMNYAQQKAPTDEEVDEHGARPRARDPCAPRNARAATSLTATLRARARLPRVALQA